ncbi:hypothetical protein ER308_21040 [Egibacter rhizosphaerae]|uniref:Prenyltransferase n=1 Tax=Egibacter rhizosphaerae TaxID=1670831 RepID=A0A411YKS0_9ACTN|nr:hypothetical protein [Egibacter rhizosphaerae]QBI21795.1 hypothetical protein ER308_21040 [Egibacter rhizosphaerae]
MTDDETAAGVPRSGGVPAGPQRSPQHPAPWATQGARTLRVIATMRPHLWLHSVPYLLVWTPEADVAGRVGLVVAHAAALTAWQLRSDFVDAARGLEPRGGLPRRRRWTDLAVTDRVLPLALGLTIVGGLLAGRLHPLFPLVMGLLAAGAWFLPLRPPARKYFLTPEVVLALGFVGGVAGLLAVAQAGSVPAPTVVANIGALLATIVAAHIRDRGRDLADGVTTIATQGPAAWTLLWLAGLASVVAGLASLELPLTAGGRVAVAGAGALAVALCLRRGRVPALVLAHGAYALGLLEEMAGRTH